MSRSVNQRFPSGPVVIPLGPLPGVGIANSASIAPAGLIWPIWLPTSSVNQRLPSGPAAMLAGALPAVVTAKSIKAPSTVIRPILLAAYSVNHTFLSGPAAMPAGVLPTGNSVMIPVVGLICPILSPLCDSANRRLSAPAAVAAGAAPADVGDTAVIV